MAPQQDGPRERAARYRELAAEAVMMASGCKDKQMRDAYLKLAKGWTALAAETDFLLR